MVRQYVFAVLITILLWFSKEKKWKKLLSLDNPSNVRCDTYGKVQARNRREQSFLCRKTWCQYHVAMWTFFSKQAKFVAKI